MSSHNEHKTHISVGAREQAMDQMASGLELRIIMFSMLSCSHHSGAYT